jgi:hypothetical protein
MNELDVWQIGLKIQLSLSSLILQKISMLALRCQLKLQDQPTTQQKHPSGKFLQWELKD